MTSLKNPDAKKRQPSYSQFDRINGKHPWQSVTKEGFVNYPARPLNTGQVAYFNFDLAKKMGLIKKDHPHKINAKLEKKLINAFNLRIFNEYDQKKERRKDFSKYSNFMASRYLQLQHENKQGKTSGDGRSIWNGVWKHKGKIWDINSRGTGVTKLAPGAVQSDELLKTGSTKFGYGCGLVEIDELFASVIASELLYKQGFETELTLCIIDNGNGTGVGVRAAPNLIRPAHIFRYLKQDDFENLEKSMEYLISREIQNSNFKGSGKANKDVDKFLRYLCDKFAKFAARLERQYIFAWLDWDGDNVLANAGIIDYGSIRQLGLRHDQYRYDDVERFSTSLNEQKNKAKLTVQVFLQIFDALKTKSKSPLKNFSSHKILKRFDTIFHDECVKLTLWQAGFTDKQIKILSKKQKLINQFYEKILFIESIKKQGDLEQLPDGKNRPALLNALKLLRELPLFFAANSSIKERPLNDILINFLKTDNQEHHDFSPHGFQIKEIQSCVDIYQKLIEALSSSNTGQIRLCLDLAHNTSKRIPENRPTGNTVNVIVNDLVARRKKGFNNKDTQKAIDAFLNIFSFDENARTKLMSVDNSWAPVLQKWLDISEERSEEV